MSVDDKFGLGAAFLAVGLGAGLILLMQVLAFEPDKPSIVFPQPVEPVAEKTADGKTPTPPPPLENKHRGFEPIEATCDAIVFLCCVPVGVYFFYKGCRSPEEPPPKEQQGGKEQRKRR